MTRTEMPPAQRMILNSNQGIVNIIESETIRKDMWRIVDEIFSKLKDHYGPYSMFAGLDDNTPLSDSVFTKDGANIVKNISYSSPLEDWMRRAILYIGTNIEKSAGDGTTSSMMFACSMLKHMNASIDALKPINYSQFRDAWTEFVKEVEERTKKYIFSAKNSNGEYDPRKVRDIVYMQAYTSSHGDKELAEAVATIFEDTPSHMWSKMGFGRRRYESKKRFEVIEQEQQYLMETEIMSTTVFNKDMGRYLEYENATLIVINGSISIDSVWWPKIKEVLEKSTKEKPAVILCYNDFDNATFAELMRMTSVNTEEEHYCFAVFGNKPVHPTVNDFTVIQAIAGANVLEYTNGEFTEKPMFIDNVYVKYEFKRLDLGNLYEDPRPKARMIRERPFFNDPAKAFYREFADTIQKFIESYEMADLDALKQKELSNHKEMYNRLRYDKTITLIIGGNTFDNLAMFDVVDDVIRASIRTLENGAVLSNNKTTYRVMEEMLEDYSKKEELTPQDRTIRWFASNTKAAFEEFAAVVMEQLYPHGTKGVIGAVPASFFSRLGGFFHTDIDPITGLPKNDNESCCMLDFLMSDKVKYAFSDKDKREFCDWWFHHAVDLLEYDSRKLWNYQDNVAHVRSPMANLEFGPFWFIVQPANADIVMLDRFGEIALKFILTERIIVKDAAYINKKGSKK